jgi:hypothetical protein
VDEASLVGEKGGKFTPVTQDAVHLGQVVLVVLVVTLGEFVGPIMDQKARMPIMKPKSARRLQTKALLAA